MWEERGAEAAPAETMNEHEDDPGMENEAGAEKEEDNCSRNMTPWEQHSAVISIPRFDYNAPSSLVQHSHSGFLITCTIKREKSATKEAISILQKYIGLVNSNDKGVDCPENVCKRRKISSENIDEKVSDSKDNGEVANLSSSSAKAEIDTDGFPGLSLVKLTRSGLLLFSFPRNVTPDTVRIVSDIIHSQESGKSSLPIWCHRIFPIQATCCLNEKELKTVVTKLVYNFVHDKQSQLGSPVKFAVGYNRRGTEDTKLKTHKDTSSGSNASELLLDRNNCFAVVAAAVKGVVDDAVVDLHSPEFSVLVELLPLSGVPSNSLVVAVSVLPRNLVSTKPRLCIRALVTGAKK